MMSKGVQHMLGADHAAKEAGSKKGNFTREENVGELRLLADLFLAPQTG